MIVDSLPSLPGQPWQCLPTTNIEGGGEEGEGKDRTRQGKRRELNGKAREGLARKSMRHSLNEHDVLVRTRGQRPGAVAKHRGCIGASST